MKTVATQNKIGAMTLLDILVVIVIVSTALLIFLPSLIPSQRRSAKIGCENQLKQVGLAFRIWQGDNNDKYPMSVSVTKGGTMELVESGTVWRHFYAMSNELNTPKILLCPSDVERQNNRAEMWGKSSRNPPMVGFEGDTNTSYFVGVDAVDTSPAMLLAGDRNLIVKNVALKSGLHSLGTNEVVGWSKKIHLSKGNVLMADASVQQFDAAGLQKAFRNTGVATNRLAIP